MAEIKQFPKIDTYTGFLVVNRPVVFPYESILDAETKVRDFKTDCGDEEIVVNLKFNQNNSGISIICNNEEEAWQLEKDFKKIQMNKLKD
jgi:hypothetical protein